MQTSLTGFFGARPANAEKKRQQTATPPDSQNGKKLKTEAPAPVSSPLTKYDKKPLSPESVSNDEERESRNVESPVKPRVKRETQAPKKKIESPEEDGIIAHESSAGLPSTASSTTPPPTTTGRPSRRAALEALVQQRRQAARKDGDSDDDMSVSSNGDDDDFALEDDEEDSDDGFVVSDDASESDATADDDDASDVVDVVESPPKKPKKAAPKTPAKPAAPALSMPRTPIMTPSPSSAKPKPTPDEKPFSFLVHAKDIDGNPVDSPEYDQRTLYIPKSAWNEMTPFEKQFWEIKQYHNDTVLFFQKGSFYELYEDDAAIGHREFDLKLTDRVKMKMVGVPEASFEFWASKFLAKGYKVGKVAQSETALGMEVRTKDGGSKRDNIVKRELKSVYTSGTIVDGAMIGDDRSQHCIAIKEVIPTPSPDVPAGTVYVALCVLDASTAKFTLCHFVDDVCRSETETLLRQLHPRELLLEKGNLSQVTLRLLRTTLSPDCRWTVLKPVTEFFNPDEVIDHVKDLLGKDQVPQSVLESPPLTLSCLGAIVWYLGQLNLDKELITAENFVTYDAHSSENMILDGQTLAHVEVLQNAQGSIEGSLIELLNTCITPFGRRLFQSWLCSPLRHASAINKRLDAVEVFMNNKEFTHTFENDMARRTPDLERIISRIHAGSAKKRDFLLVLQSFRRIAKTADALREISPPSELVNSILAGIPSDKIIAALNSVEGKFTLVGQYDLLPQPGQDDVYEQAYGQEQEAIQSLNGCLAEYKKQLKCSSLIFRDIGTKDIFQVQVPAKVQVPANWTKMSSTKDFNRYWSPQVERLVKDLKEARERMAMALANFHLRLFAAFDNYFALWLAVTQSVAQLDCLACLSRCSSTMGEPCVRPNVVDGDRAYIRFVQLRHPVYKGTQEFVPNDVSLGGSDPSISLLTGPNMAGKSTLLRMTCAAVIMAQVGCYIPAEEATICPVDAIYSRMGANDMIFANASTFKVEMDDCNKIMTKASPHTLVILDELGRGTSTYDGMSIAYAVLHRLATHVCCIGFFATHFTALTDDFAYHPNILQQHMQTAVDDVSKHVVFLYSLARGVCARSYGPHVAKMAGIDVSLVERAIAVSREFEDNAKIHEAKMRANETLPLSIQADAAYLLQLARNESWLHDPLAETRLDVIEHGFENIV